MTDLSQDFAMELAQAVRNACVDHFLEVFENSRISGLCCEGAAEVAIGQVRCMELETLVDRFPGGRKS